MSNVSYLMEVVVVVDAISICSLAYSFLLRRRRRRPPPPCPCNTVYPTWTHHFIADTNSSNRVRAASIAFMASDSDADIDSVVTQAWLLDRSRKKIAKQEKFLQLPSDTVAETSWISDETIKNEFVVFDGTASYPPPQISPPLQCEYYYYYFFSL